MSYNKCEVSFNIQNHSASPIQASYLQGGRALKLKAVFLSPQQVVRWGGGGGQRGVPGNTFTCDHKPAFSQKASYVVVPI